MSNQQAKKLHELFEEFGVAMLITKTRSGDLHAQPMALAEVAPDGTIWLLTDRDSAKVTEIDADNHALLTVQSKSKFASLSGTIKCVDDREKVSSLWNERWKLWFPDGKDDPNLVLLRFDGERGEYWDYSGMSGIKYLIAAGQAYLKGIRLELPDDSEIHDKVIIG